VLTQKHTFYRVFFGLGSEFIREKEGVIFLKWTFLGGNRSETCREGNGGRVDVVVIIVID
tara:strand:- start:5945 stop:6124 length:180 start_codon:yes stop_codon:yes gene_type:complete